MSETTTLDFRNWKMDDSDLARAFNKGSDARILGFSDEDNPYQENTPHNLFWIRGYHDADIYWGTDPCVKWPVFKLPSMIYQFDTSSDDDD